MGDFISYFNAENRMNYEGANMTEDATDSAFGHVGSYQPKNSKCKASVATASVGHALTPRR